MASAAREDTGWRAKVGGWGALWSTALGRAGHSLACVSSPNASGAASEPQSTDRRVEEGEVGWSGAVLSTHSRRSDQPLPEPAWLSLQRPSCGLVLFVFSPCFTCRICAYVLTPSFQTSCAANLLPFGHASLISHYKVLFYFDELWAFIGAFIYSRNID